MRELGFIIHPDKSLLTSSNWFFRIYYIVKTHDTAFNWWKKNKIKTLLTNCLHSHEIFIRELCRILGNVATSFPAVTFGPLHYWHLEKNKIRGLKYPDGNLEGKISVSSKTVSEIHWWINSIDNSSQHVNNMPNPDITILTDADASLTDWWITNGVFLSWGLQHKAELDHFVLELTAVKPGIYTYCNDKNSLHVRVIFDNVTAIAYINNMGGMKNETGNNIGRRIWSFSMENKLSLSSTHTR